jgi:hypothetical protein
MSLANQSARTKVHCFCRKCKGTLVDPRTRNKHRLLYGDAGPSADFRSEREYDNQGDNIEMDDIEMDNNETDFNEMECDPLPEITDPLPEIIYSFLTKKLPMHESEKFQRVKKGKISEQVFENLLLDGHSEDSEDDNDQNIDFEDSEDSEDDEDFENDDYEEVNFASPDFDNDEPNLPPNLSNDTNDTYTWVILWILQYQQRFKLSNVAIDSLFKFLSLFLLTIDSSKFTSFPSSLYMAKKKLEILKIFQYAACNKCHKLYDMNEIQNKTEIMTCSFVNYPNHTIERFRRKCENALTKKIDHNNEQIFRPIMTYPLVNIKQQLTLFFGRKDFEASCRKWVERNNESGALFDIYDGKVWNEFKDDNDDPFFTKEYADTHLGLMLNMDWFQPFTSSQYWQTVL